MKQSIPIACFKIFGLEIFDGTRDYFSGLPVGIINTLNPHCYVISRHDPVYYMALLDSDILIPDGIGVQLASYILTGRKINKIAGSDLHSVVINELNKRGASCFYLGSSENTLKKIRERLAVEQPGIKADFFSPPFKDEFSELENKEMISTINNFKPDVLFVGMTAPKQEKWVYQNRYRLNVPTICSIGAVFDFYAGTVKRPGKIWISLGLEWLGRLFKEPKRMWRRNFISTPLFLYYVLVEKIRMVLGNQ
jgi:N-acetylglucosaminyldiphosphoundecaprenol N-acetyl-beta-D-mannosaminyltransferase